jgi:flagellar protein FliO/FliZ
MQSAWLSLLVFVLLLAAIPATAWLMRRGQSAVRGNAGLEIAGAIAVGARERIALVRADRKWLVVGITPQSITMLAELDAAPCTEEGTATVATARFPDFMRNLARRHARPS